MTHRSASPTFPTRTAPAGTGLSTSFYGPDHVAVKDDTFALANRRDQLHVVNITSQTSVRTIELGARASDITISPDRTIAAIATQGTYMVQVNISSSDPVAWTTQVISDITNITYDYPQGCNSGRQHRSSDRAQQLGDYTESDGCHDPSQVLCRRS